MTSEEKLKVRVKVALSNGDKMILSLVKWEMILQARDQLVQVTEDNGEWLGRVINKAHIVGSNMDMDATKEVYKISRPDEYPQIQNTPEQQEQIRAMMAETRKKLQEKSILKK
jgi:PIN domain nuclease of toxin-antitoxin system